MYYEGIFGKKNVLVAIQKNATDEDGEYLQSLENNRNYKLVEAAKEQGMVAFALNNACFLDASDYEVMDTKAAILLDEYVNSPSRVKTYLHGSYLKSQNEMLEFFSDYPVLINNASKMFDYLGLGDHLNITLYQSVLPDFPIPDDLTEESYMRKLAEEGLSELFEYNQLVKYGVKDRSCLSQEQSQEMELFWKEHQERLDFEIDVISKMGFCGYFLIVQDFIIWAKKNGVPVGHGRGSGAGSLVAYSLKITSIPPLEFGLLFERFLNPDRVSMPDFDIDFGSGYHPITGEEVNRDSVINYVQEQYNNPNSIFPSVGQIATHSLISAKSGVKKVAKTRFVLPSFSDNLTKMFPDSPEVRISDCMQVPEIMLKSEREREVSDLMAMTARLEGLKQNSGVHAGGVFIAPREVVDFAPIQIDPRDFSKIIAQFDKNDIEYAGLVKFDFLGLQNLTSMEIARKYIKDYRNVDVDLSKINYTDKKTFELLRSANSHGVFQVESAGMQKLLRRVQCDNMEDLSALLALYRPGPIQSGMVDNFIDRKHGRENIYYPDENYQHECLESVLKPTYGVILYQEQVMQCAQKMASFSLGGADLLRRAMGKKKPEEMIPQRKLFLEGAEGNNIDPELAMKIFDIIEKFAGYGFNKSHSMAYAHITFQTAYLKTHYLTEYMAALLTYQSSDPDKLKLTLVDCNRNGLTILPPDINKSATEFLPEGKGSIRYGLLAIRSVGEDKLKTILAEREKNGEFKSVAEMRSRCGGVFDKKVSEGLLMAGALDSLSTEKTLPENALRKSDEIVVPSKLPANVLDISVALNKARQNIACLTKDGLALREILTSLTCFYGERYDYKVGEMSFATNAELANSTSSLLAALPLMVERGASQLSVDEDIKNITIAIKKRDVVAVEYRKAIKEIKQIEENYKLAMNSTLVGVVENSTGDTFVSYDKRAYLWEDIRVFVCTLKVSELQNKEKLEKAIKKINYSNVTRMTDDYRLKREVEYLSYYVTGHPFDIDNLRGTLGRDFGNIPISQLSYPSVENLDDEERKKVEDGTEPSRVAGVICDIRVFKIKKESSKNFGRDMAIIKVDDSMGEMSMMLLPDLYLAIKSLLFVGSAIAVEGVVLLDHYSGNGLLTTIPTAVYDVKNPSIVLYEKKSYRNK